MKKKPDTKTVVIFRRYRNGEIDALFPFIPATTNPAHCTSYAHVGQHASADPICVVTATKPATPEQYAPLLAELTRIGYDNLDVRRRVPRNAYHVRKCALSALVD